MLHLNLKSSFKKHILMQSVMLMACRFQQDKEVDLDTSIAPGGRGKCRGYCHIPSAVPVLCGAGVRALWGGAGGWIHVSSSKSLALGFPEEGDFSANLTSLVFCRQISNDCYRIHGEWLARHLPQGKELFCIFIHCTSPWAECLEERLVPAPQPHSHCNPCKRDVCSGLSPLQ